MTQSHETIIEIIINDIHTLFLKNPCKTCIVRVCCQEECERSLDLKRKLYPHEPKELWQIKLMSASLLICWVMAIIVFILVVYKCIT
jgi:hypothetical protein